VVIRRFKDKVKKHFREVLEIKTRPHEIALGFGIGTFFANFPTFGLEILIIFLLLITFKSISKISLLFAYVVWNPFITYSMIPLDYLIGNSILGDMPITIIRFELFSEIIQYTLRYLLGSLIVASTLAIISYFAMYYFSKKYQKNIAPILEG